MIIAQMLSQNPAMTISLSCISSYENTMAFGGVATGIIKAMEAPRATGIDSSLGSRANPTATAPRIGRKVAVEAVFDVISVR